MGTRFRRGAALLLPLALTAALLYLDFRIFYHGIAVPLGSALTSLLGEFPGAAFAAVAILLVFIFLTGAVLGTRLGSWVARRLGRVGSRIPILREMMDLSDKLGGILLPEEGRPRVGGFACGPRVCLPCLVVHEREEGCIVYAVATPPIPGSRILLARSEAVVRPGLTADQILRATGSWGILR